MKLSRHVGLIKLEKVGGYECCNPYGLKIINAQMYKMRQLTRPVRLVLTTVLVYKLCSLLPRVAITGKWCNNKSYRKFHATVLQSKN